MCNAIYIYISILTRGETVVIVVIKCGVMVMYLNGGKISSTIKMNLQRKKYLGSTPYHIINSLFVFCLLFYVLRTFEVTTG